MQQFLRHIPVRRDFIGGSVGELQPDWPDCDDYVRFRECLHVRGEHAFPCRARNSRAPYIRLFGIPREDLLDPVKAEHSIEIVRRPRTLVTLMNPRVIMKIPRRMAVLYAIVGWAACSSAQTVITDESIPMDKPAVFSLDSLVAELKDSGQSYLPFLTVPTLRTGLYSLPAGGTDHQEPHGRDEVYYVIEGRSGMTIEGRQFAVKPGDVIFVEAHASHRFHDIAEPLLLLVFFSEASN